jgi:hypothetical protein
MKLASLRAISSAHDRAAQAGTKRSGVPDAVSVARRPDPVHEFSQRVTCELTGTSILRYSRRVALLNRARKLGIDRFNANLLIAAVQNRGPATRREQPAQPESPGWLLPAIGFAVVQSFILTTAWTIMTSG